MEEDSTNLQVEQEMIEPTVDEKVISTMPDEETPNDVNNSRHLNKLVEESVREISLWDQEGVTKNELVNGHIRSNSTSTVLVGLNKKVTVPSRYLTGSIRSCHDLCKLGYINEIDMNARIDVVRTPPMLTTLSEGEVVHSVAVLEESSRKKSTIRQSSFPVAAVENGRRVQAKAIRHSGKWTGEPKTTIVESPRKKVDKPGNSRQKVLESSSPRVTRVREIRIVKGEEKAVAPTRAFCPSKSGMKAATNMNGKNCNYLDGKLHGKNRINHQQDARAKRPEDVPEKTLYMIEPKSKGKSVETSERATLHKKGLSKPQGGSRFATREARSDSRCTNFILPTLHKPFRHQVKEQRKMEFSRGDVLSGDRKSKHITPRGQLSTPKSKPRTPKSKQSIEPKVKVKKAEVGQSGDKGSSIWKMTFKRGTVTAPSGGDSSLKKLKFRKPKSISEDQNVEVNNSKASYKNEEVDREEPHENEAESEEVVLKRQETMGKKDDLNLNNVIEKTASELVKSRKSKVKALVGAFEALISLGDRRSLVAARVS